ncbi:DUF21-domain-containing protein [Aulographum hederae CBS 113979]|uniref:DUF21-domain-containing protein n=1 Tax=Aulographum hederae CBS 113979 TaxID=1176131 RepID=A0A6G1GKT2_9PEZI|nr:DUF21-domain-containing protein [Aulographum hederae CBS 113979]
MSRSNMPCATVSALFTSTTTLSAFAVALLGLAQTANTAPTGELLGIFGDSEASKDPKDASLWAYLGIAVALVLLGGAFAGLTIALMGQDEIYLQVIATSGEDSERKHAKKVLNLLKKGKHWVLVTLLLSNVITNETLPIVLDRSLGGGWPAVLSSTVLIVIFGEIAPQSVCVRFGLPIGAWASPFVLMLMYLLAPVAWPTAKLLDWLLGEDHGTMYKKTGLKTLVTLHRTLGSADGERLSQDEVTIISAVLDLKEKTVGSIMTPMSDVFTLSADAILDEPMMDNILSAGYSRIPIYAPDNVHNFVGMLLVKMLITYDPEDAMRVRDFSLATLPETRPDTSCLDIVNFFQEGKSHMVLVSNFPGEAHGALGVVTLEDVIEELIGEEIIDESDVFVDVHKAIRRMNPAPRTRIPKGEVVTSPEPGTTTVQEGEISRAPSRANRHHKDTDSAEPKSPDTARKLSDSKEATFMMRRRSSGGEPTAMRGTGAELRAQLGKLGPSNVASRPKQTRINTVKIKPGVATVPEDKTIPQKDVQSSGYDGGNSFSRSHSVSVPEASTLAGGVGEGLLANAGHEAKDGVRALQQGYGTMSGSFKSQRSWSDNSRGRTSFKPGDAAEDESPSTATNGKKDDEALSPRSTNQPQQSFPPDFPKKMIIDHIHPPSEIDEHEQRDESPVTTESSDTIGELREDPSLGLVKRQTARSGSITESTVEAGGIKKLVLEATPNQSVDSDIDAQGDGAADGADGKENGSKADGKKKKRKKRTGKKKHGGKGNDAENSPLLGGS